MRQEPLQLILLLCLFQLVDQTRRRKEADTPALPAGGQAGPLTEMVLLGNVALQAGTKIEWDCKQMKVANAPAANKFIRREYRKGWSM